MSEGQKKRKYGDRAAGSGAAGENHPGTGGRRAPRPTGPGRTPGAGPRGLDPTRHEPLAPGTYRQEDLRAEPEKKSSAGILVGVLTAVAVLLFAYVHALVLPLLGGHFGTVLPELRPTGFGRADLVGTAARLGTEGLSDYRSVHRSSGLLQPLLLALAWVALVAVAGLPRRTRWALWAVSAAYAVATLAGNAVLEAALADPASGPAGWASALVVARWVLLLGMVAEAVWLFVRLARSKVDAFSRGELPEQVEARRRAGR